jgi:tRNA pseudouridine38-40 synthase
MRYALGIEYDGAPFCGWQSQAGGGAVQDAVEAALSIVADTPTRVICAGRTDAGVHAIEQIVHFDTEARRPDSAWVRGVNTHLPASIAVRWAQNVPDDFHARFSARGRHYRYLLLNRPQRPGLQSGHVGWYHHPLDVQTMAQAAAMLLGEHDFSSFRSVECQAKSPIKQLREARVMRHGETIVFDFAASAFLHHMVRNIVGALVYVGKGKHPPEWIAELLARRDRSQAAPTFGAAGLYFAGVDYDPAWRLNAAQAGIPKVGADGTAFLATTKP